MARTLLGKVGKLHVWGLVLAVFLGVLAASVPPRTTVEVISTLE